MPKKKNPDMHYTLTCKVTGKSVTTNPVQYNDLMRRYNIGVFELEDSYVSREGRRVIASEKLNAEQACEKYGIHPNVANQLKCTRMVHVKNPRKKKEIEQVSVPVQVAEKVTQPSIVVEEESETSEMSHEEDTVVLLISDDELQPA